MRLSTYGHYRPRGPGQPEVLDLMVMPRPARMSIRSRYWPALAVSHTPGELKQHPVRKGDLKWFDVRDDAEVPDMPRLYERTGRAVRTSGKPLGQCWPQGKEIQTGRVGVGLHGRKGRDG